MIRNLLQYRLPVLRQFHYFIVLLLLSSSLLHVNEAAAQGNLLISPRRIIFDGSKKTQEINLANTGKDTAKYLISVMEIRMKEDGGFEEIATPDSGQFFANKFLRFFPRTVTLAPNESQVVKVQLIKTNEITEGEYRSHVYFRAVPDEKALGEKEEPKDPSSISVQLTPVFGITIPVIIRSGASTTEIKISDCSVKMNGDNTPVLAMALNRTGNMSAYGDIDVELIGTDGKATNVGSAKGVAIYTPNKIRKFQFELNKDSGADFHKGKLHIAYLPSTDDKSNKSTNAKPLAETELALH